MSIPRAARYGSGERAARALFRYSIVYLFLLFGLLILDRVPGGVS